MGNMLPLNQAAADQRSTAVVCMPVGTCPGAGVMTPLVRNTDGLAAAPPSALTVALMAAVQWPSHPNYQDKTRIRAAGGGESGSHPAWDPV